MYLRSGAALVGRARALSLPLARPYTQGHEECMVRPPNPFYDPRHEESLHGPKPRSIYAGRHLVTQALGIGIGPELMEIVRRVFQTANAPIYFEEVELNEESEEKDFHNLIYSIERNGVGMRFHFGRQDDELMPRSFRLKRALDLCINLTEVKSYKAVTEKTRLKGTMDVVVVTPNLEGAYALLEHEHGGGVENLRVTTEYNTRRVTEFAFEYAVQHKRRRVTLVYNKGIMNWAEGTIIGAVSRVAARYPKIPFHKQSMKGFHNKISNFDTYNGDVLVTTPMYGGIIKNILFGMTQGTGLYCSQNLGPRYAVFEPAARNKGIKMMGKNKANPIGLLDAGVKMLKFLGHHKAADRIEHAIDVTVEKDLVHTVDMLGTATTDEMVANIVKRIREKMPEGYKGTPPVIDKSPPMTKPYTPPDSTPPKPPNQLPSPKATMPVVSQTPAVPPPPPKKKK